MSYDEEARREAEYDEAQQREHDIALSAEGEAMAAIAAAEAEDADMKIRAEAEQDRMKYVLVVYTNRSEYGLLEPVIDRLAKDPDIHCKAISLHGVEWQLEDLYKDVYDYIKDPKPDLVVIGFDRVQMLMVATAAMVNKVPVCQIGAGDLSGPGTWDDKVRYAITSIADLVFCDGWEAFDRVELMQLEGEQYLRKEICEVGSTFLDDIESDYSLVPQKVEQKTEFEDETVLTRSIFTPFDLVLYNPETAVKEHPDVENLVDIVFKLIEKEDMNHVVFIGSNGDPNSWYINLKWEEYMSTHPNTTYYPSVPRALFLGLLEKADRLIGNSSAFCLEAPTLRKSMENIHLIGDRNLKSRMRMVKTGASDKIVEHIRRFLGID